MLYSGDFEKGLWNVSRPLTQNILLD
jgi:hypothetical protein